MVRCKVLCIVAGCLALTAAVGGCYGMAIGENIDRTVIFACGGYAVACFTAAFLLHRRVRSAYFVALPCVAILLPVIPIGTVFGVLGLVWLQRAHILERI